ncbi:MAG: hypothetical protein P0121_04410 [Nitrospira sp.]|nr:hypothetical protein [Nitrospira sp.]
MPFDLQVAQVIVGLVISLLTILGTIFGWFGRAWRWASLLFSQKLPVGLIDVPSKTMVLIPVSRQNAFWWHMGSMGSQPVMQIVGDLNVTNISMYDVVVMGAKLRKPKAVGHALVRAHDSNMYSQAHSIPRSGISELRFDFFVQPPVKEEGKPFKADVAIIDQFGNEHWLKGLEFLYI